MKYFFSLGMIVVLGLGLSARLLMAPERELEVRFDTLLYQVWGWNAYERGMTHVYDLPTVYPSEIMRESAALNMKEVQQEVNYLPPYLYFMWGSEGVRRLLSPTEHVGGVLASVVQKLPGIFFDLATALLLALIVKRKHGDRWGLIVAAIYVLHPTIAYLSAGWGQTDTIYTFFLVLTVWLMERGRLLSASAALTVGFFFKMQSIALAPLLIYELIRTKSSLTILKATGVAFATAALLIFPFILAGKVIPVLQVIFGVAGSYPRFSMFALNLWWILAGGFGELTTDDVILVGIPLVIIGAAIYYLAVGLTLFFYYRRPGDTARWLAASLSVFAFFLFPTEMHERYLFPVFALMLPLLPSIPFMRLVYFALSLTYTYGIIYVLFYPEIHESGRPWTVVVAFVNLILFSLLLFWFWRRPQDSTS